LLVVSNSYAQTGNGFDLTWNVIGGGGSQGMAGSGYTLDSTTGQNVVAASSGSGFTLKHGFWALWELLRSYLPLIIK
jgi:hypothetical protein